MAEAVAGHGMTMSAEVIGVIHLKGYFFLLLLLYFFDDPLFFCDIVFSSCFVFS